MQREETIAGANLERIVEAIFVEGRPDVYEAYSAFDSDIVSFSNAAELNSYISWPQPKKEGTLGFVLYYPDTKGFVERIRIALDREKCEGHTYRYRVNGWGLIQFQVNSQKTPNIVCRFAVNTEKRANAWFPTYPELQSPALWDWKAVERHARRLIRELRRYAQRGAPMDRH